jgi:predicted DCC family thiol-disulfide oxidoreductase YuxK
MFLLERDPEGSRFLYAPLQGATFRDRVPEVHAADSLSSMVVLSTEGAVLLRSTAVIHLLRRVGGAWIGVSIALSIVPRPVRDLGYRFIAAVRGRWLKHLRARCRLMPPGARERFLA